MKSRVAFGILLLYTILPVFVKAGLVANAFGICYDQKKKEFTFTGKILNLRQLTPEERIKGDVTVSIKGAFIKRINKHYYVFTDSIKLNGREQKRSFVAYKVPAQEGIEQELYSAVLDSKRIPIENTKVKGEGKFLTMPGNEAQERGVLYYEGRRPVKVSPSELSPERLYQISLDEYLIVWDGLRLLTTSPTLFADLGEKQVKFIPLTFVYSVWNDYAYGVSVDSKHCNFHLVNLRDGSKLAIDGRGGLVTKAYVFDENHILLFLMTGEQQMLSSGTTIELDARYVKFKNLMFKYKENRLIKILTQDGSVLWKGALDETKILRIDLDEDLHNEIETVILKLKEQDLLIDCISGEIYAADNISHVGFGFFGWRKAERISG